MCQPVVSANRSLHKRRLPVVGPRPNNSFNPNPLRYTNSMADQACHAVGSTTQVGLTQALGLMTDIHPLFFVRSEEHTSELQSLMRISYAVFCLKKQTYHNKKTDSTKQKKLKI